MTRRGRGALAAAVVATVLVAPSATGADVPPDCVALALSPDFGRTRSVLCPRVVEAADGSRIVEIWLSEDAGRTWTRRAGVGLALRPSTPSGPGQVRGSELTGAMFSAQYAVDRTLHLAISDSGLFSSTDEGDTWASSDVLATGSPGTVSFTPYVDRETLAATDRVQTPIAFLAGTVNIRSNEPAPTELQLPPSARIDPPVHRFVDLPKVFPQRIEFPGRATDDDQPALFTGFSFDGSDPTDWLFDDLQTSLFACDLALSCPERRFTFPDSELTTVRASANYGRDRTLFAISLKIPTLGLPLDWDTIPRISTDGGRTFRSWPSLEQVAAPVRAKRGYVGIDLAVDRALRNRVVARVQVGWLPGHVSSAADPPHDRFMISEDSGRTWRVTGSRRYGDARPREDRTWPAGNGPVNADQLQLGADGRLFALSSLPSASGEETPLKGHCSVDNGRTWTWPCAR